MKPKVRLSPSAKAKLIDLTEDDSDDAETTTKLLGTLSTVVSAKSEMEVDSGNDDSESEGHVSSIGDFEGDEEMDGIEESENESEDEDESLVMETDP